MKVKLPRLLNAEMQETARLHPVSFELTQNAEPPSTATLMIPRGDAAVQLKDWIRLYTKKGDMGVYRVKNIEDDYAGEELRLTLEHGICALGDWIVGEDGTLDGDLGAAVAQLIAHQKNSLWEIGSVASADIHHEYRHPNLLSEIVTLVNQCDGLMLTFDQSALPWTLNIVKLSDEDACEGRFGRNLQSLVVTEDDSELYTRVYIEGRGEVRETDTIAQYGPIETVLNVAEHATDESAERYISTFMENHKHPTVAMELDAADLSEATGEKLDSFELGKMCRAVLPEYGLSVQERIVSITHADVLGDPERVRVSLANRVKDTSDLIMEEEAKIERLSRAYGGLSGSIQKNTEMILLRATKEELVEYQDQTWNRFNDVSILLDANTAAIELKASQTDVNELASRVSQAEIDIDGANAQISLKASQTLVDELGTRVSAAEIELDGINSEITLKADKIDLEGYVTADQLAVTNAEISNLINGYSQAMVLDTLLLKADEANVTVLEANSFTLADITAQYRTVSMGSVMSHRFLVEKTTSNLDLQHSHAVTVGTDGKITLGEVSSSGGSFNIADTKIYKDAVSAAYEEGKAAAGENITLSSAGWINGQNVVTASNGQTYTVHLPSFTSSASSWSSNKLTVYFYTDSVTGPLKSHVVDASSVYSSGWNAGYAQAKADTVLKYSNFTIKNTAANYFFAEVTMIAEIGGEQVKTRYISKAQQINVGQ